MQQITNTILLINPINIRANEQTSVNNYYQKPNNGCFSGTIQVRANKEFNDFAEKLKSIGVNVLIFHPKDNLDTPDSHFPNNWISFHENGNIALYPMFAENRRMERREEVLDFIEEKGFDIKNIIDYSTAEEEGYFLEGTGSIILDRQNRKAYCALSPRSDEELFIEFCEDFEYFPIIFTANQTIEGRREAIYHTNVMMCMAESFVIICLDSIDDKKEKKNVIAHLKESGKEIIAITQEQVSSFAGNMLQVIGEGSKRYLVMSGSAYKSLTNDQLNRILKHCEVIYSSIETIEVCGGGSVRCMMAEVFLPKD